MILEWITLASYIGAVVTIMGIGIQIGRVLQKLEYNIAEGEKLKQDFKDLDKRVTVLETKIAGSFQKTA